MSLILDTLNDIQRQAVSTEASSVLVLAGAGSGKTRVLVHRIAFLIENKGILPNTILALTFTNKAALEMKKRASSLLGGSLFGAWVETFHGFAHRVLRIHATEAGLSSSFAIMDGEDQSRLIKKVIEAMGLDPLTWPPKTAQNFINSQKEQGLRPQAVRVESYGPKKMWLAIYAAYEERRKAADLVDFADLLLYTHELFLQHSQILSAFRRRFKAILLDEFQDSSQLQYALVRLLTEETSLIMAVGDDDQLIYSWRGAKSETLLHFTQDFPQTKLIRLEQNYRSSASILSAANALILNNKNRLGKTLWTQEGKGEKIKVYSALNNLDEARFVSEEAIKALKEGFSANEIAVLYRSNAQSRVLEEALLKAGIAYKIYGGLRFFERAEIKDALAYLRLLMNPHDNTAFDRVHNHPSRGIGQKTLAELQKRAHAEGCSYWQAADFLLNNQLLDSRAAKALTTFMHLITSLSESLDSLPLDEYILAVIQKSGLWQHMAKLSHQETAKAKLENLQELVSAGRQFLEMKDELREDEFADFQDNEAQLRCAFLAHTSLDALRTSKNEVQDYLQLMTLHAAKGLEFSKVFIVGLEEELFPSRQSIEDPQNLEEERRLCYVGITRAKKQLTLSYAKNRLEYGKTYPRKPSRFLSELPKELLIPLGMELMIRPAGTIKDLEKEKAQAAGLRLGQEVMHSHFGQGVLLAVEGDKEHTRVKVGFANNQIKWLVLAYANLVLID